MSRLPERTDGSEFLLYTAPGGDTRVQVRLLDETVWLTQKQMAELFDKDVRTINEHIQNVFDEAELDADSVIRKFRITASDGKTYEVAHRDLADILVDLDVARDAREKADAALREILAKLGLNGGPD
jgi:hypothetical protein